METFGQIIRTARKKLSLTQKFIAQELGVPGSNYNYWERDRRTMPSKHLAKLAKILKIDQESLKEARESQIREKVRKQIDTQEWLEKLTAVERTMDLKPLLHAIANCGFPSLTIEDLIFLAALRAKIDNGLPTELVRALLDSLPKK